MEELVRVLGRRLEESAQGDVEVPWHRVINAQGTVSFRGDTWRAVMQRERLELEGVAFDDRGRVDLKRFRWRYPPR